MIHVQNYFKICSCSNDYVILIQAGFNSVQELGLLPRVRIYVIVIEIHISCTVNIITGNEYATVNNNSLSAKKQLYCIIYSFTPLMWVWLGRGYVY